MSEWIEYQKLVLSELKRLTVEVKDLRGEIVTQGRSITALQIKATLWGGGAGLGAGLLTALGMWMGK